MAPCWAMTFEPRLLGGAAASRSTMSGDAVSDPIRSPAKPSHLEKLHTVIVRSG